MEFLIRSMKEMWVGVIIAVFIAACAGMGWIFEPAVQYVRSTNLNTAEEGEHFTVIERKKKVKLRPPPTLSVVIPAYNEEERLPIMLDSALMYLEVWTDHRDATVEVVIVDDGSTDQTSRVAEGYIDHPRTDRVTLRVVRLHRNCGKGGALMMGVRNSRGENVLIADADGATEMSDLDRLYTELLEVQASAITKSMAHRIKSSPVGLVLGSRAHLAKNSIATRAFYRTVLMAGFHLYVQALVTARVHDTQCGFKLFTRTSARLLFANLHLHRWAFDTEIIYLAEHFHMPISEVAVNWREVDGSKLIQTKLDVVTTSLTMARDILCMRLSYLLGLWTYPPILSVDTNTGGVGSSSNGSTNKSGVSKRSPITKVPGQSSGSGGSGGGDGSSSTSASRRSSNSKGTRSGDSAGSGSGSVSSKHKEL